MKNKFKITVYCGEAEFVNNVTNYQINERYMTLTSDKNIKYVMLTDDIDYINVDLIEINEGEGNGI